jgi:nicotinate-nucleotide adenylyltransferase
VIGADLETEVSSWYGAEELRTLVRFIVVPRTGYGQLSVEPNARPPMPAVSSSDIRERLRRGYPVDALVPRSVLDYIHQRKLYGASP